MDKSLFIMIMCIRVTINYRVIELPECGGLRGSKDTSFQGRYS